PVVENAPARAQRGAAAGKRRPGHADSRRDIVVVAHVGFRLVPDAHTEGEVSANTRVVLKVQGSLQGVEADIRVADASCVASGTSRDERVETLERVRPEIIRGRVRPNAASIDLHAGAKRMNAAHVVEIRANSEAPRTLPTLQLRPARCERLVHTNRG